jgi:hypothetical protein
MEKIRIRDTEKNIPDPQHCPCHRVLDDLAEGRGFVRVHSGTEVLGGHQIGQAGNSVTYFSMG